MSIEIKDRDSVEACMKMVELLKKYDRFETTVTGGMGPVNKRIRAMDDRVCVFSNSNEMFLITICYFLGLLPYINIIGDAFWMCYMTKDYLSMIHEERKET